MFNLYQLGWYNFQQLCHTILREILGQTVESFLTSNDAGRDGAFSGTWKDGDREDLRGKFVFQCKFSEKDSHTLSVSDLSEELPKIELLVKKGICENYILITNSGVSGRSEIEIKAAILSAGPKQCRILSSTWIISKIKESARLRMLVPRVYGLGDLSQILDGRALEQGCALLESLSEDMSKVVRTQAYEKAANALEKHGFVLLIGEPAVGKTTIASLLAMASLDRYETYTVKVDHARELKSHWNPHEGRRFFWIDDAFGVNQYESHLVGEWNHLLSYLRVIIDGGAKIVMTSRDYIYRSARRDLKESAFPLLNESQVVIDVKDLTDQEKKQILYNHLKLGRQPKQFIQEIKPYLEGVASIKQFVPETARRLSDPAFTKNLSISEYSLKVFVVGQREFLRQTLFTLDNDSKAALAMIYMRGGVVESPIRFSEDEKIALERMQSSVGACVSAFNTLKGSFVRLQHGSDDAQYRFKHPTVGDAFASLLVENQELLEVYVSGTTVPDLMLQVTCGDVKYEKAVVLPRQLFDMVNRKIDKFLASKKADGTSERSRAIDQVYWFLSYRCSKDFLRLYLDGHPSLPEELSHPGMYLDSDDRIRLVVRLNEFGLFQDPYRQTFVDTVVSYATEAKDFYVITNDRLRSVLNEEERGSLFSWLENQVAVGLSHLRGTFVENWDDSFETAEEYMEHYLELLRYLEDGHEWLGEPGYQEIRNEKQQVSEWIDENTKERHVDSTRPYESSAVDPETLASSRSIFDDIDA